MAEKEKKAKRKKRKKIREKMILQGFDNVQDFEITQPLSFTQSSEPIKKPKTAKKPKPAATKKAGKKENKHLSEYEEFKEEYTRLLSEIREEFKNKTWEEPPDPEEIVNGLLEQTDTTYSDKWFDLALGCLLRTPYAERNRGALVFMENVLNALRNGVDVVAILKAGFIAGHFPDSNFFIERMEQLEQERLAQYSHVLDIGRNFTALQYRLEPFKEQLEKMWLTIDFHPGRLKGNPRDEYCRNDYEPDDVPSFQTGDYLEHGQSYEVPRATVYLDGRLFSFIDRWVCQQCQQLNLKQGDPKALPIFLRAEDVPGWDDLPDIMKGAFDFSLDECDVNFFKCYLVLNSMIRDQKKIDIRMKATCRVVDNLFKRFCSWLDGMHVLDDSGWTLQKTPTPPSNAYQIALQMCGAYEFLRNGNVRTLPLNFSKLDGSDIDFSLDKHFVFLGISQHHLLYPRKSIKAQLWEYLEYKKRKKKKEKDKEREKGKQENELEKLRYEYYATLAKLYPKSENIEKMNHEEFCRRQVDPIIFPYEEDKYIFSLECPCVDKSYLWQGSLRYFPRTKRYKLMEDSIISDVWVNEDKNLDKTAKLFFDDNRACFLLKKDDKYKCKGAKTPEEKKIEKMTNTERIWKSSTPTGTVRYFQVMKDIEVPSPTLAATLVVGYKRNGRQCWKNYKGESIEDLNLPTCKHQKKKRKKEKPKPRKSKSK